MLQRTSMFSKKPKNRTKLWCNTFGNAKLRKSILLWWWSQGSWREVKNSQYYILYIHEISLKLESSQKIKKMLKSENIRRLIKKVDDEKSAMKFRTLNQIIKDDPEINEFIQEMLFEIGYADSNRIFISKE